MPYKTGPGPWLGGETARFLLSHVLKSEWMEHPNIPYLNGLFSETILLIYDKKQSLSFLKKKRTKGGQTF